MERPREVLVRVGLVRAFTQISGVDRVQIVTENGELKDSAGNVIGAMTRESFVENAGSEINNYQYTTLTLYFANETGDKLVPETRSVYYSTSVPLERVVVEQLVKGPAEEGHYAVIPEKSVILSATIADRICYINMNRAFQEEALDVSESIQIYSVVNSLLDSCEADKVQLSVEGSMDGNLRSSMPLYTFYEKNDQLVVHEKEES